MDPAVFASWFDRYKSPVRKWLSTKTRSAEVDDLAQEVFIRLMRYTDDELVKNPSGYLFRIASNVASEWRERCVNNRPHDNSWLEDLQIEDELLPENAYEHADFTKRLRVHIDALPIRQREILLLHINDGLTYKQICSRTGLTYRTVLRDLTRAYVKLRVSMNDDLPNLK